MDGNDSFERSGFEWLKIDGFSSKNETQGHDTILKYYWLAHQSKKRGWSFCLLLEICKHKAIVLMDRLIKCGPCGLFLSLSDDNNTRPLFRGFYWLADRSRAVGSLVLLKENFEKGRARSKVGSIARRPKPLQPAWLPNVLNLTIQPEFHSKLPRGLETH